MNIQKKLSALAIAVAACASLVMQVAADDGDSGVDITEESFGCLTDMTPVRHFYVDNLLGNLEATLAIANSAEGGKYPPGTVIQLVPTEAMVKHAEGWNAATRDWEFFELEVSAEGTSILNRGFVDVVNSSGGNCFGCHLRAAPQWDMVCEKDHGCDAVPVTAEQILALQKADPRCAAEPGESPSTR